MFKSIAHKFVFVACKITILQCKNNSYDISDKIVRRTHICILHISITQIAASVFGRIDMLILNHALVPDFANWIGSAENLTFHDK